MELSHTRRRASISAMADPKLLVTAIGDSFKKLDPRVLIRNPVMFTVEIVAALVTILFMRDIAMGRGHYSFAFQIILWLWFTVLFANFAEAVAEGRGKAQAASLRQTKTDAMAKLLTPGASTAKIVAAGDLVPSDGDVIEGVASVNEAAITGESAPVIRESGGDRSAVTGGTTVSS